MPGLGVLHKLVSSLSFGRPCLQSHGRPESVPLFSAPTATSFTRGGLDVSDADDRSQSCCSSPYILPYTNTLCSKSQPCRFALPSFSTLETSTLAPGAQGGCRRGGNAPHCTGQHPVMAGRDEIITVDGFLQSTAPWVFSRPTYQPACIRALACRTSACAPDR